jgi:hypothetical protein
MPRKALVTIAAVLAVLFAGCGGREPESLRLKSSGSAALSGGHLYRVRGEVRDSDGSWSEERDVLHLLVLAPEREGTGGRVTTSGFAGVPDSLHMDFEFDPGREDSFAGAVDLIGAWELRGAGRTFDLRMGNLFVVRPAGDSIDIEPVRFVLAQGGGTEETLARFRELLPDDPEIRALRVP